MDMTHLAKWVEQTKWANTQWIDFVEDHFREDEFLLKRLAHIFLGEQAWFQRLSDQTPDPNIWRPMTFPELREMHRVHASLYAAFLGSALDRRIAFRRFTGVSVRILRSRRPVAFVSAWCAPSRSNGHLRFRQRRETDQHRLHPVLPDNRLLGASGCNRISA